MSAFTHSLRIRKNFHYTQSYLIVWDDSVISTAWMQNVCVKVHFQRKDWKAHTCCSSQRERIGGIKRAHGCHKAQWIYTRELSRWRACKLLMRRFHAASASVEQLEECRRGAANRARAITHALRGENTRVAVGVQRLLVWWLIVMIGSLSSYDCHVHYRFKRNVKIMFPPRFRINPFRL